MAVADRRNRGAILALTGPAYLWLTATIFLPLSANPPRGFDPGLLFMIAAIHVSCVGLPVAFMISTEYCPPCSKVTAVNVSELFVASGIRLPSKRH